MEPRKVVSVVVAAGLVLFSLLGLLAVQIERVVGHVERVDRILSTSGPGGALSDLGQLSDMRRALAGLGPEVRSIARLVATVRGDTSSLEELSALKGVLDELNGRIDGLGRQFAELEAEVAPISPLAIDVRAIRGELEGLTAEIRAMTLVLQQIAQHVENLDRKTGFIVP